MPHPCDVALDRAADLLHSADALVIAAGAGLGVDSGLPDFRGPQGLWRAYPALGRRRLSFPQVASPQTFHADPLLAWGFYGHRLALYRRTVPHAGFALLQQWARSKAAGGWVFTSNVDGQFQRSGWPAGRIVECHGALDWLQCTRPCGDRIWPADGFVPEVDEAECRLLNPPPRCPDCGALARPNVLMFGDGTWLPHRTEAQEDAFAAWLASSRRPLVIEIGAGTAVPSVRHFSAQLGRRGARLVRINPDEAAVAHPEDVALPLGALAALQALAQRGGPADDR